jgi:hypothetical protein
MALNFDDEKCDLLILRTGKVLMLLQTKDELLNFCKKYNTVPLFARDFDTHIDFNKDKSITELQDISTVGMRFMKNYNLDINGCVGFKVTTYGEACKIYQNINELSIFNGQLDTKIRGHDDVKHFRLSDKKEVMYVKLNPI